jgi:hypothetical protein
MRPFWLKKCQVVRIRIKIKSRIRIEVKIQELWTPQSISPEFCVNNVEALNGALEGRGCPQMAAWMLKMKPSRVCRPVVAI